MLELQNKLDYLIKEIKDSGFEINNNFKIYNPNKPVYVIEEYYKHEGEYECDGKIRSRKTIDEISKESFYKFLDEMKKDKDTALTFLAGIYDYEIEIDDITIDNYDISYCEDGKDYVEHIQSIETQDDYVKIDFGEDYRGDWGGYIILKSATEKYLNNFEEEKIDTFDD